MRRILLSLQIVALAVGLTACTGDALSLDPVASAATKTVESGSSRVEFTISMKLAGESIDMSGSGAFDYRNPRGSLSYDIEIPELGSVRMEMRMVGTKLYLRMPSAMMRTLAPSGKPWLGVDLRKSLDKMGLGGLDFAQQQDPAQALQFLRAASADVKEAGSSVVKGVEVTRYVGRMDLREAVEAGLDDLELTEAERAKARRGMQWMMEQLDATSLPFEVFVDDDGLLRRMTMDMRMGLAGEDVEMSITTDYFDFGTRVDVQAPPARDVFDATGLLGS